MKCMVAKPYMRTHTSDFGLFVSGLDDKVAHSYRNTIKCSYVYYVDYNNADDELRISITVV